MDVVLTLVSCFITALFTSFVTFYFSTRNHKSQTYEIFGEEMKKCMEIHINEKHQKDEQVNNSIRHMELKQTAINMKLTFLTNIMSKIAEKLQITITPDMFPKDGDGDV